MRIHTLFAGLALAALIPAGAMAQESCQERAANRVAGTAVGAIAGALLGSAIAPRGDRTAGAVVGGVAGGVIGNQAARGPRDCDHAYGWYDNDGHWHANRVDASVAGGYYDRNGDWIDGPPPDMRRPVAYRAGGDPMWMGYPEFSDRETRLRGLIEGGVRDGLVRPDDARDLMHQLGDIQIQEASEYRNHGGDIPYDDRQRILSKLDQLDRQVDRMRQEP